MKRTSTKSNTTDVRWYRLKKANIVFLNQLAKKNNRKSAAQLDEILDEMREQK